MPDLPALMHSLRRSAARIRRDCRRDEAYMRGYAFGLTRAANEIGGEIEDEVTLEALHACTCREQGTCTACELLALTYDLPALRRLADDRCACEQERQCPACRVLTAVNREYPVACPVSGEDVATCDHLAADEAPDHA